MMSVIAVYMYRNYYDSLRATMEQVVEPLDAFAEPPAGDGSPVDNGQPDGARQRNEQMQRSSENQPGEPAPNDSPPRRDDGRQQGIMTVFFTPAADETTILSQESLYDE